MPVPTVVIGPNPEAHGLMAAPERSVKLGRLPATICEHMPKLAKFFTAPATPLPEVGPGYGDKGLPSIRQVNDNEQWGDCVIAGKMHGIGIRSGNDLGTPVLSLPGEPVNEYHRICGAGDNGCYIPAVLDEMKLNGLLCGGKKHKIDGYAAIDTQNLDLCKAVCIALGGFTIGFNVPGQWMGSGTYEGATWKNLSNPNFVGGHDVFIYDFDKVGFWLATWGLRVRMEYAAFQNSRIVDEAFAELGIDWYNSDKLAPSGFDVNGLKAVLADASSGNVPPWQPAPLPPVPPIPPVPPVPPTPPTHEVVVIPPTTTSFHNWLTGTVQIPIPGGTYQVTSVPVGEQEVEGALGLPWFKIIRDAMALAAAVAAQNWPLVISLALQLVNDFKSQQHLMGAMEASVAWGQLFKDIMKLVTDVEGNAGIQTIIEDAKAIARDLGVNV